MRRAIGVIFTIVLAIYSQVHAGRTTLPINKPMQARKGTGISPFIVGGLEAAPGQFPYQVSIRLNGGHYCGGSLISLKWVLTAAHCMTYKFTLYSVQVGSINRTAGGKIFSATKKTVHALYDSSSYLNDIALLQLNASVTLSADVKLAVLPTQDQIVPVGNDSTVSGWGYVTESGTVLPTKLRYVTTPVVSNEECQKSYGASAIYPSMICAGLMAGGKASCQGDSGGPIVATLNGTVTQIGIVSWGIGCAQAIYYDVNTRVPSFRNWIKTNANV